MTPPVVTYSWPQYNNDIEKIADMLSTISYSFDFLVGIARGGVIPAVHLSHKLKKPVEILRWSFRDGNAPTFQDIAQLRDLTGGKRIILVEDIVDSGVTLRSIDSYIYDIVESVKVVALFANTEAKGPDELEVYSPNTFQRSTDAAWRIFPWEV